MKIAVKALIAAAVLMGAAVAAQADTKFRVGTVDITRVQTTSKVARQMYAPVEKVFKDHSDKVKAEETKMRQMQEAALKEEMLLSDAQKAQKVREIQSKERAIRDMKRDAEEDFGRKKSEVDSQFSKQFIEIVGQVAKQKNVSMVVEPRRTGILWAEEDIDITDDVIKAFDAKAK